MTFIIISNLIICQVP
uniref:Uncharacterized protein n=1 Tax=Moniliophthora roreri TaxID=221103 RepID=A0A0W0FXT3_MONRR